MYIKHSKFRNTGILFEVVVRKITSETLSGKNSPAIDILKSHFVNTELGKEYKLYETIFKSTKLDSSKANAVLDTVLEQSKKLNRSFDIFFGFLELLPEPFTFLNMMPQF